MKNVRCNNWSQIVEQHVNTLQIAAPPFQYSQVAADVQPTKIRHIRHPWCGTEVIVTKFLDPHKGEPGRITDVLLSQDSRSSLKLAIQLTRFNPARPYPTVVLDVEDVAEQMHVYRPYAFVPYTDSIYDRTHSTLENYFKLNPERLLQQNTSQTSTVAASNNGGSMTPMPTDTPPLTPAWNPSAQTPDSDSIPHHTPMGQHILLNPLFLGVHLVVIADGEGFINRKLAISLVKSKDEYLSFQYTKNRRSLPINHSIITPVHPNVAYYDGLVVVIRGPHCGKFGRRIHHIVEGDRKLMLLAVVQRSAGAVDIITGEQLILDAESMCIVNESAEDRQRNKDILKNIRAPYKGNIH